MLLPGGGGRPLAVGSVFVLKGVRMSNARSSSQSKDVPFYKNAWFWLAAIAVVGLIGTLNGPPDSQADLAPIMSPAPSLELPAPAPTPEVPAFDPTPTPITNNNVILLGSERDPSPVLRSLPQPSARRYKSPPSPAPAPEVPKATIPARQSSVDPDCLPSMVAHHQKVAEFYQRMIDGK